MELSIDPLRLIGQDLELLRLVLFGFCAEFSRALIGGLDEVLEFGR